ncbi:NAD-dependent epimerase [Endozoicomonas sp. OPT23]|uniref:NAD(P)-binding oxidoreductase n=1 Tax=Endozoicomonas sp. OPT23 TaxID=2072845 RepID=UPI00129B5B07|nr:NAD(P)-binding oxidoreductase [Endozoicomonas sp. OPT23]MRI33659.1 NAD-dependent epimerase [Endozoicomonas sp. OPT23]
MAIFVAGASGATGRLLVSQLIDSGESVRIVLREGSDFPEHLINHPQLVVVRQNLLDLSVQQLAYILEGCSGVVSCLGHTPTFSGVFGQPRSLVLDAVKLLCQAIEVNSPGKPVKLILMNSTGCANPDIDEQPPLSQRVVVSLLRWLLPPHRDNEMAAAYLSEQVGSDSNTIEWVAVRPDALTDEVVVSDYSLFPSPVRNAIFDSGKTSRINVGHFMAELLTNDELWRQWCWQRPVIYNNEFTA